MKSKEYDRQKAREYATKWAYSRNPSYYNFDKLGGDCTNFVSQCIYAGSGIMNYKKDNGWYYNSLNDRSPSWTGVEFLHQYLVKNKGIGPYGKEAKKEAVDIGDIVQLSFDGNQFAHTILVVKKDENIYGASHTFDSFRKRY